VSKWMDIRVKTERSQLDAVRATIINRPQKVMDQTYKPALKAIADEGRDYIRYIILASTTRTGEARVAAGGQYAGRRTGKSGRDSMYTRVRSRIRGGTGKNQRFVIQVGWDEGKPGYAIFQEYGTKNGVVGMNALGQAHEFMLARIRRMASGQIETTRSAFIEGGDEE
jgi:hypothetical protein